MDIQFRSIVILAVLAVFPILACGTEGQDGNQDLGPGFSWGGFLGEGPIPPKKSIRQAKLGFRASS